jgi:hypothetical protein
MLRARARLVSPASANGGERGRREDQWSPTRRLYSICRANQFEHSELHSQVVNLKFNLSFALRPTTSSELRTRPLCGHLSISAFRSRPHVCIEIYSRSTKITFRILSDRSAAGTRWQTQATRSITRLGSVGSVTEHEP